MAAAHTPALLLLGTLNDHTSSTLHTVADHPARSRVRTGQTPPPDAPTRACNGVRIATAPRASNDPAPQCPTTTEARRLQAREKIEKRRAPEGTAGAEAGGGHRRRCLLKGADPKSETVFKSGHFRC